MSSAERHQILDEPLDDLLLALEARRASAVVHIETPEGQGEFSISHGVLRTAVFGEVQGQAAVAGALSARVGSYRLQLIADKPSFSGTLFQPGGVRSGDGSPPSSGLNLRSVVEKSIRSSRSPLMLQRMEVTGTPAESKPGSLRARVIEALRVPSTGLDLMQRLPDPATSVLRVLRDLLDTGVVRFVSIAPSSDERPVIVPSRRVLITDSRPPTPSTARSPTPPLVSRTVRPPGSEPFEPAPSAVSHTLIHDSTKALVPSRPRFGSTLPSNSGASDRARPPVTGPGSTGGQPSTASRASDSLGSTVISGTSPDVLRHLSSRPSQPEPEAYLRELELRGDAPVPSERFEAEILEQLEELHEKISSSRDGGVGVAGSPEPEASLPRAAKFPRVGRYEVIARLRSGGMGSVYLCRVSGSAGFERLFAMKVLKESDVGGKGALADFFREARVLASLHHPNVVGVFDVGTPSEPYLVLDYVEGGSLHELLVASPGDRNPARLVSIFLDALSGLHAAHQACDNEGKMLHLVHGDVTPHNLLVGTDGACRVADFGIARTDDAEHHPGVARGKPGYVAPEMLLGRPADHRADLFSMGVAIYYAMTGVHPFRGASVAVTLDNVLNRALDPPSSVGLEAPPAFDWIIMRALEKNPEDRFSSAEEMLVNLRRVAARQDLMASPSEVAGWVTSALAPLLQARRAAAGRREMAQASEVTGGALPSHASNAPVPMGFSPVVPSAQPHEDAAPNSYASPERTVALFPGKKGGLQRSTLLTWGFVALCVVALIATILGSDEAGVAQERPPIQPKAAGPDGKEAPDRELRDTDEVVIPDIVPASR